MKPAIIEANGRVIVNALRKGEVSLQVQACGGTAGSILTLKQAAELSCAITAAIREAAKD